MSFNWFYLESPIIAPFFVWLSALAVDFKEENESVGVRSVRLTHCVHLKNGQKGLWNK